MTSTSYLQGYYDSYYAKCIQAGFTPKTVGECDCRRRLLMVAYLVYFSPALAFSTQLCDSIPMTEKDIVVEKVIFPHE